MFNKDWRDNSCCMRSLIQKLYEKSEGNNFQDVTFKLPDGSEVGAHKLVLGLASPFFEAQFFGLLATEQSPMVVKNIESFAFRKVLEFIYKSGDVEWTGGSILEYWSILEAAHMYLVPGLISLCNTKLSTFLNTIPDNRELVEHVNRAAQLYIYEGIYSTGLLEIKARLGDILNTDNWNLLEESVVLDILDDQKLKVPEGELFQGMINWCKYNTEDQESATHKFESQFSSKVRVKNMTKNTFLKTIGESDFTSPKLFKKWTFEFMNGNPVQLDATRYALHPLKIHQTSIVSEDFLEARGAGSGVPPQGPVDEGPVDSVLWRTEDEFEDVGLGIRIFQKVTESAGLKTRFGILLETVHRALRDAPKSAITERVSVKMVAKKKDGTVLKKLFKPIEDTSKEGSSHKSNVFVLSKNKEERMLWHVMEIVVIIDRRPTCHIKGISGEEFARTVCSGQTQSYLSKAKSFHYDVKMSLKAAVEDIAKHVSKDRSSPFLNQWLYIFTKGYVSNLRSRRAMPNDYWTADTVEDYMRCKVINFPIGVHNEAMRRDAFRTWIISRKITDEKEKDRKSLFVCTYNPDLQDVQYLKTFSLPVETRVETLGLMEHISLGSVQVDDKFFYDVTFGCPVTTGVRIFIRRIFPIQNEECERMKQVLVCEAVRGTVLSHIDDCHVLVVQLKKTFEESLDFDQYLLKKINEKRIICINKKTRAETVVLGLGESCKTPDLIAKLCTQLKRPRNMVQVFKCYSGKTIEDPCSEQSIKDDECMSSIFQYCDEERKLFYQELPLGVDPDLGDSRGSMETVESLQPLEESQLDQDKWIEEMDAV
ncbi:uncharacterized protein LOC111694717 isoform X2 [Eurytemora carolleeae]|uniref:uncharacterized protein LOC111694717 isoform X2 n=1 Tax=Eurytemora carolleeae TaxID=1294199 RepID=UPI000C763FB0|nr:uncharacterized protein LOC111694717 isoform X2 [Eurytemora carolleeae]|eukprot:XP_023319476.1 uncharacterized protein LOC111694717 isoform X2 [Eurytemora affinis]